MNIKLTEQIINHIFSNFLIINASEFDQKRFKGIKSSDFLLDKKVSFEDDNNQKIENNTWGVQLSVEGQQVKILLADCSVSKDVAEYALIVAVKDVPTYGVYSAYSTSSEARVNSLALIALNADKQNWVQCNIQIQATFLAGMEQIKDIPYNLERLSNYSDEYNLLLSFLNYHELVFGDF